jgi:hypothetical protein
VKPAEFGSGLALRVPAVCAAVLIATEQKMFIRIAGILALTWLAAVVAFGVAATLVHLILFVAAISLLLHFVSGTRRTI